VVVAAGRASSSRRSGVALRSGEERHLFSASLQSGCSSRSGSEASFAAKQLGDGRVLTSDLAAAGDADEGAAGWRANVQAGIRELLPRLEYVDFPILASGAYDITPDRQPILGAAPGQEGLYLAAGFSGHGFMIAPAVGRILADAVEGRHDPILDALDAARFADGRPVPEHQIV
jgi:sarcosine oxidase subunit beta